MAGGWALGGSRAVSYRSSRVRARAVETHLPGGQSRDPVVAIWEATTKGRAFRELAPNARS